MLTACFVIACAIPALLGMDKLISTAMNRWC